MFIDIEHNTIVTMAELKAEYEELKQNNETEMPTFQAYLNEVTGKNGTLERMVRS